MPPPPPPYPRTLGATYLAAWLAANGRLLNQLVDDYRTPDLLLGLSWISGQLAHRLAELAEIPIEKVIADLVRDAANADHAAKVKESA